MDAKKTNTSINCQVGLLEITPSASEKTCLFQGGGGDYKKKKTENMGKQWEKDKKFTLPVTMKLAGNPSDFVWKIDCTTSSNEQRARIIATVVIKE